MRALFIWPIFFAISCSPKNKQDFQKTLNPNDFSRLEARVVQNYSELVFLSYQEALKSVKSLNQALKSFVEAPSEELFEKAKEAWSNARKTYALTEAFRFYGGPIDSERRGLEIYLNARPIEESFVDYVQGQPSSGVINQIDLYPEISKSLLVSIHRKDGVQNVSTGFRVLEFLLWGQDLNPDGPGQRLYTDYVLEVTPTATRRAEYLLVTAALIEEHLNRLVEEWSVRDDNFRALFLRQSSQEALSQIMTGLSGLLRNELYANRIGLFFETKSEKLDVARFSDSSLEEHFWNLRGTENVYLGRFQRLDGPGLSHLVAIERPSLDIEIKNQFDLVKRALQRITTGFDQAVVKEELRPLVKAVLDHLEALSKNLDQASELLKLSSVSPD